MKQRAKRKQIQRMVFKRVFVADLITPLYEVYEAIEIRNKRSSENFMSLRQFVIINMT